MLTFKSNTRRTLAATLGVCLCPALLAYAAAPKRHTAPRKHAAPSLPVLPVRPATAAPSPAAAPGDTVIYNGQPAAQAGLTLAKWGGGDVADSTEQSFAAGGHALKVTTLGPYQGATITFNTPADLGDLTDKSRFFQVTVRVAEQTPETPGQFPGQGPGGFPGRGFPGGGFPGGGGPGGAPVGRAPSGYPTPRLAQYPGAGGRPGGGYPGAGGQGAAPVSLGRLPVKALHLVFTLDNGARADVLRSLPDTGDTQNSDSTPEWTSVSVPLAAIKFPAGTTAARLKSVTVGADNYGVLYVGQMRLTTDTTPITCYASSDNQDVTVGEDVNFHATAGGGASTLHYGWNFGTGTGNAEQATGPSVTTRYLTGGKDYTVTLTVTDADGFKKPATATTVVHVEQQ